MRHVSDSDEEDEKPATSSRLLGELQRLNVSYNPDAKSELDRLDRLTPRNSDSGRVNHIEVANIVREVSMESQSKRVTAQYVEPRTFDEAWNHPDPKQQEFWRSAIRKEFRDRFRERSGTRDTGRMYLTIVGVSSTSGYSKLKGIGFSDPNS